jgi:hypothetical protein
LSTQYGNFWIHLRIRKNSGEQIKVNNGAVPGLEGHGIQVWRVAEIMFNKQLRTAGKGWYSSLRFGSVVRTPHCKVTSLTGPTQTDFETKPLRKMFGPKKGSVA